MAEYRIFSINNKNKINGSSTVVTFDSDGDAIRAAQLLKPGQRIEIWQGTRIVAALITAG
jgi:hypothetical protein